MNWKGLSVIGALAMSLGTSAAWAQRPEPGDVSAGADVATRWCTGCHLIHPAASGPAVQGPPAFDQLARTRAPEALRSFLTRPHRPMPPLELSRADIDNLVAYIESLR